MWVDLVEGILEDFDAIADKYARQPRPRIYWAFDRRRWEHIRKRERNKVVRRRRAPSAVITPHAPRLSVCGWCQKEIEHRPGCARVTPHDCRRSA